MTTRPAPTIPKAMLQSTGRTDAQDQRTIRAPMPPTSVTSLPSSVEQVQWRPLLTSTGLRPTSDSRGADHVRDPSPEFWQLVLTQEVRQAGAFGASLQMAAHLPRAKDEANDPMVEVACLEAWFVHMRLLIEYFGLKRGLTNPKDFTAKDLSWNPVPDEELADLWDLASQHVVHFSRVRTSSRLSEIEPFDTSRHNLERLARKIFTVAEDFVTTLERTEHEQAAVFRMHLKFTVPRVLDR